MGKKYEKVYRQEQKRNSYNTPGHLKLNFKTKFSTYSKHSKKSLFCNDYEARISWNMGKKIMWFGQLQH